MHGASMSITIIETEGTASYGTIVVGGAWAVSYGARANGGRSERCLKSFWKSCRTPLMTPPWR